MCAENESKNAMSCSMKSYIENEHNERNENNQRYY